MTDDLAVDRIRTRLRKEDIMPPRKDRADHIVPSHAGPPWSPEPWQNRAACRDHDPELFHDPTWQAAALTVCRGRGDQPPCPVRDACLAQALHMGDSGVYGGTTEAQRRRMRRRRAA